MRHQSNLAALIGGAHVETGDEALAFYAGDLVARKDPWKPLAAVRPGSAREVSALVGYARETGLALIPRGAGLSYTGGVVGENPKAIVLDLTRLTDVSIDPEARSVRVGAGLSWAGLSRALAGTGLRPQQHGPISGEHSTIGGAVSQNVPGNLEGVLGLEVVMADSSIVTLGAGSRTGSSAFYRHFGPDLTGLFCGDCGSFGIKTAVTLRLVPERPAAFASFSFASAEGLVGAMAELGRANLGLRLFGMDPQKNADAAKADAATAVQTLGAVLKKGKNPFAHAADIFQLARARVTRTAAGWTLHATAEAPVAPAADALIDAARTLLKGKATEIDNVLPKTLHAKPYSVRGMVGRAGERWVPIHGILPLDKAVETITAIEAYLGANTAVREEAGITTGFFFSSSGPYVSMEPMFYWPDELGPSHERYLSPRNWERFGGRSLNERARAIVEEQRAAVRAIFLGSGAHHAQLARYYGYIDAIDPATAALAMRIKQALDPDRSVNPGALGL